MKRLQPKREKPARRIDHRQAGGELLFARYYVRELNVTRAAILAGYSPHTASVIGSQLLKKPNVKMEVDRLQKKFAAKMDISTEAVLQEIAKVGFASMEYFVRLDGNGDPHIDLSDLTPSQWAALGEVTTETYMEGSGPQAREVKRVKIKLHDKLSALEKLGKHLGMFGKADSDQQQAPVQTFYTLKIGNAAIKIEQAQGANGHLPETVALPQAGNGVLHTNGQQRPPGSLQPD